MKFQNPIIHRSKVSNFTEKWKNQNFKILYFCKNLTESSQKLIRSSTSQPQQVYQMKALASILFEISCTQDFQRDITQKKGIT